MKLISGSSKNTYTHEINHIIVLLTRSTVILSSKGLSSGDRIGLVLLLWPGVDEADLTERCELNREGSPNRTMTAAHKQIKIGGGKKKKRGKIQSTCWGEAPGPCSSIPVVASCLKGLRVELIPGRFQVNSRLQVRWATHLKVPDHSFRLRDWEIMP